MNKQELLKQLKKQYKDFMAEVEILNEEEFMKAAAGKWTAGQQLDHLCRALRPLVFGFRLPKFIPRLLFGKANRPSKSYDDLVAKYLRKIKEGGKASGAYVPKAIAYSQKKQLLRRMQGLVDALCRGIERFSEEQLDQLILPHPLIGKVTIREMLYFTAYHAAHHKHSILKNLE